MKVETAPYLEQERVWPTEGRHILAQYDGNSVVVYQAFKTAIGAHAVEHQRLGGGFKFRRTSWIKPNFLWLMYRSCWGTKVGQEVILALRVKRSFFDKVLAQAVPSYYDQDLYPERHAWQEAIRLSSVRLQWDPDHDPAGTPLPRRAVQLGLRREALREYAEQAILEIIDLSPFVAAQRTRVEAGDYSKLQTPRERVYLPPEPSTVTRLKLSPPR